MRHPWSFVAIVCCVCMGANVSAVRADVSLPPVINDHMVLQRGVPVPIWGTAAAGEKISVTFRDQTRQTVADAAGRWQVSLDAMQPGGPGEPGVMTIVGNNKKVLEDVVVGEVWVGSGQSNMEWVTSSFGNDAGLAKIVAEEHPQVRLATAAMPWRRATPEHMKSYSALLLSFGVALQRELGVPVGLMVGAVGGKPSGFFITRQMLDEDEGVQAAIARWDAARVTPYLKKAEEDLARYSTEKAKWDALPEAGRPAAPVKPAPLRRGGQTWGEPAGHLYETFIKPMQPYAIRGVLWDQGESGTALEGVDQYTAMGALIKGWRKAWGAGEFPFIFVQKPSGGGYAWPGSFPAATKPDPDAPPAKLPPLPAVIPIDGETREMFHRIMQYPRTGMVIGSDLGGGLHPQQKSAYGMRAALVARALAYGQPVECYGPIFESAKADGGGMRVRFTHAASGLCVPEGESLQGFAIAGKDRVFHWAKATIDGDSVVVSSEKVAAPVAVRYAWTSSHPWANLFNKERLPALAFRTDSW